MMIQTLKNLSIELQDIAKKIQIVFDNVDSIREQVKTLKSTQQRLYEIQNEVASEARNLGFTNFFDKAGKLGSRGLNLIRGIGETVIGVKLAIANVAIPIISGIVSASGNNLIENGCGRISEAFTEVKSDPSKENKLKLLSSLKNFTEYLINNNEYLIELTEQCTNSPIFIRQLSTKKHASCLIEKIEIILDKIKIEFDSKKNSYYQNKIQSISEAKEELASLKPLLNKTVNLIKDNLSGEGISTSYILNLPILEALLTFLSKDILGVKLDLNQGEIAILHPGKNTNTLKSVFDQIKQLNNTGISSILNQCNGFESFLKEYINNTEYFKEMLIKEGRLQITTQKVNDIRELIILDLDKKYFFLIQQKIKQIINNQKMLNRLDEEEVDQVIQSLHYNTGSCVNHSVSKLEMLISVLGNSLITLEVDMSGELILATDLNQKKKIGDIQKQYLDLQKIIQSLIQKSEKKEAELKSILKTQRITITIASILLFSGFGFFKFRNGVENFEPEVSYLSFFNTQVLEEKINSVKEKIPIINTQKKKEQSSQDEQFLKKLVTAKKIATEASLIVQHPPHSLEVWQKAQAHWLEAIKLLESIPQYSSIFPEVKGKLSSYHANYNAITQRIETEQKANENFKNSLKLGWQVALLVQKKPDAIEVWQDAQSKLEQAIRLLQAIPKSTLVENKAQEKIREYKRNDAIITTSIKLKEVSVEKPHLSKINL